VCVCVCVVVCVCVFVVCVCVCGLRGVYLCVVCVCVRGVYLCVWCVCVLHLNNNSLKFPKVETEFKSHSNFNNSFLSIAGQPTFESKDVIPS